MTVAQCEECHRRFPKHRLDPDGVCDECMSDEPEDDSPESPEEDDLDLGISDDNWACGTLDPNT